MFAFIRRRVAAAVLGGFSDALETLEQSSRPQHEPVPLPEPLRLRLEAGDDDSGEEPAAKQRKATR